MFCKTFETIQKVLSVLLASKQNMISSIVVVLLTTHERKCTVQASRDKYVKCVIKSELDKNRKNKKSQWVILDLEQIPDRLWSTFFVTVWTIRRYLYINLS